MSKRELKVGDIVYWDDGKVCDRDDRIGVVLHVPSKTNKPIVSIYWMYHGELQRCCRRSYFYQLDVNVRLLNNELCEN